MLCCRATIAACCAPSASAGLNDARSGARAAYAFVDAPPAFCNRDRLHGPVRAGRGCCFGRNSRAPSPDRAHPVRPSTPRDRPPLRRAVAGTAPSTAHQIRLNLSPEARCASCWSRPATSSTSGVPIAAWSVIPQCSATGPAPTRSAPKAGRSRFLTNLEEGPQVRIPFAPPVSEQQTERLPGSYLRRAGPPALPFYVTITPDRVGVSGRLAPARRGRYARTMCVAAPVSPPRSRRW
jgi:hypothetical protein